MISTQTGELTIMNQTLSMHLYATKTRLTDWLNDLVGHSSAVNRLYISSQVTRALSDLTKSINLIIAFSTFKIRFISNGNVLETEVYAYIILYSLYLLSNRPKNMLIYSCLYVIE